MILQDYPSIASTLGMARKDPASTLPNIPVHNSLRIRQRIHFVHYRNYLLLESATFQRLKKLLRHPSKNSMKNKKEDKNYLS
jgi:hypothetical protein